MYWLLSRLTWSKFFAFADSAYSTPSPGNHLSEISSPTYPDRPIRPLPKRRLRSRLSPVTAESHQYPEPSGPSKPLFSLPFVEPVPFVNGSPAEPGNDSSITGTYARHHFDQSKNGYQFRGSDPESDDEDARSLMRRYKPQTLDGHDQRAGIVKYTKVSMPMSAPSPQDSVDGYDSFENTNNKKKRKIPTSGSLGGHHSSLSAEMAHMGISPNREFDISQAEMDGGIGHYYGTGSSAVPAAFSSTAVAGAGRGRYGKGATRISSERSPLGVSTNGSNALQAGRQLLQKQDFASAGQQSIKGEK